MPDLLIELFSEEIPARMQGKARDDLRKLVTDGLVEAGLTYASAGAFSTPRRLVLSVEGLTSESRPVREERKGPSTSAPAQAVEGFLRSTRSLIQTIGRAARNVNGKVILYGDRITESMRVAIEETERRRALQHEHNLKHGIVPKGLNKKIVDMMDTGGESGGRAHRRKEADPKARHERRSAAEIAREVKRLEEQMFEHARNLEFEQAAALRDQVAQLRSELLE